MYEIQGLAFDDDLQINELTDHFSSKTVCQIVDMMLDKFWKKKFWIENKLKYMF